MSDLPKNENLTDLDSPTLLLLNPTLLTPPTDFQLKQSPSSGMQPIITPDEHSKSSTYFLPTGFDLACEYAEQEFKAKYGTIPKIGKAPRDVQRLQGKVTPDEIKTVQKYIEKCLTLYMSPSEVITALQQAEIDPGFTSLVWEKLNETNEPYFKAYGVMLRVKEQIMAFNYLISQQAQLMQTNRLGFYSTERTQSLMAPMTNNPFANTVLPSLTAPTPVAPAITIPRDLPPDDDDEDDSDEEFNEKPKTKKKKTTKKAAKPKSPKPPKTKAKRGKAAASATTTTPVVEPTPPPTPTPTPIGITTPGPSPTPSTPIQLVPISTSPGPTLLFPAPGQRPPGGSILVVNSPNFPPTQPPKSAPRQIAASGVPVVTNRGVKPPLLSPIPVISAKPGTAPTSAQVSIKPKTPVPIVQPVPTGRPQVKPPSQLQMPVISKGTPEKNPNSNLSVENASDLDTNVFLNE